jgi:hypothetical protein
VRNWAFLKQVLQGDDRIREEEAWALLDAVNELFPEKFAELKTLTGRLESAPDDEEDAEEGRRIYENVRAEVGRWTAENRIACPAVDRAALRLVCGDYGPEPFITLAYVDEQGRRRFVPSLTADPEHEPKPEFLKRADAHYDEVARLLATQGEKVGPAKRDLIHFRFLAARLVGGYTPAQLALNDPLRSKFNLPPQSEKTIADETRKLAEVIGIQLPTRRGPIPGKPRQRRMPSR